MSDQLHNNVGIIVPVARKEIQTSPLCAHESDDIFRKKPIFLNLSGQDVDIIANFGHTRFCPKNRILIHEGDESDCFYILIKGRVKVYISNEYGSELILRYLDSGEYFGELALIDEDPCSASVVTTEDSRISYVSRAKFEECLHQHPHLAVKLIRSLSTRIRDLTDELSDCALKTVYQRLRKKLMQFAVQRDGEYMIAQRLTQQEIASMVGCGREMITRLMQKLQDAGYVEKRDQRIYIVKKLPKNLSSYK